MEAGLIGLGKMGLHIAMNMQSSGIRAYGYDIQTGPRKQAKAKGIPVVQTLQELIASGRGHNRKHGTPTCRVAGGRGLRDRRGKFILQRFDT